MKAKSQVNVTAVLLLALLLIGIPAVAAQTVVAPEWVSRYSASRVVGVGVDNAGNVYVTGDGWDPVTFHYYATVKYDESGEQLWEARYHGSINSSPQPIDMAIDEAGHVFVTGSARGDGPHNDFATVKYDTNGSLLWEASYHHPGNDLGNGDTPAALAVDGSGNVYVTGSSYDRVTEFDYATVKYDPDGIQLWAVRFSGPVSPDIYPWDWPQAIAVDGSGNVYVTGESNGVSTGGDYATIKYDAYGNQAWVARYNGPGNSYDRASDITVDGLGNVYVTGLSGGAIATVKYNSAGTEQWVTRYSPGGWPAVAVDDAGNVYVHGGTYDQATLGDIATIKYDASGNQLWAARYNGPRNLYDGSIAFAVDGSGNAYVAGSSQGCGSGYDYVTFKYDDQGNRLWIARYNGPGDDNDTASAIALDGSGYVYVTGVSQSSTGTDVTTIKYGQTPVIDQAPPSTTSVSAAPNPALSGTEIILNATVDDCRTGGGNIASAEYQVDDGAWNPMSPQDGSFDNLVEDVVANLGALPVGVHDVCVRGSDGAGNTGLRECSLVAVYDPTAGFAAGAGWIDSQPGAYAADPDLTGKAIFGFTSRYMNGASAPTGHTEFIFSIADLRFHADTYEWLVIAGARAQYKGSGAINGAGDYGFMLTAIDGKLNGGGGLDKFRIKIWDKETDTVVYDNQMDAGDSENPTTEIGAGQIMIQR
jgi:hypothetical protein